MHGCGLIVTHAEVTAHAAVHCSKATGVSQILADRHADIDTWPWAAEGVHNNAA